MSDADPTKPDLSLVATDWLLEELEARHDALLVVRETTAPKGASETFIHHRGGVTRCIGLAVRAEQRLLAIVRVADQSND